jgi:putative ABC transport system substrate-binding protein
VLGLLGAAGAGLPVRAQRPPLRRVGVLAPSTAAKEEVTLKPFFDEMRRLGWIEGQTVHYDRSFADDRYERLDLLAQELAARKPELIFAPPASAASAARRATSVIPIVFGTGTDPVGAGLVASLPHPGGNVTGVSSLAGSLAPKRLQLLREILPGARSIGMLFDPTDPSAKIEFAALAELAPTQGISVVRADVANAIEIDRAMDRLLASRVDAIFTEGSLVYNARQRLIELAQARRVPVVGHRTQMAEDGAIFAYGSSLADQFRRAASLVDKILQGARPADLAVEQPSLFELTLNLKAARALGIRPPQSILLRADRVIE